MTECTIDNLRLVARIRTTTNTGIVNDSIIKLHGDSLGKCQNRLEEIRRTNRLLEKDIDVVEIYEFEESTSEYVS